MKTDLDLLTPTDPPARATILLAQFEQIMNSFIEKFPIITQSQSRVTKIRKSKISASKDDEFIRSERRLSNEY